MIISLISLISGRSRRSRGRRPGGNHRANGRKETRIRLLGLRITSIRITGFSILRALCRPIVSLPQRTLTHLRRHRLVVERSGGLRRGVKDDVLRFVPGQHLDEGRTIGTHEAAGVQAQPGRIESEGLDGVGVIVHKNDCCKTAGGMSIQRNLLIAAFLTQNP